MYVSGCILGMMQYIDTIFTEHRCGYTCNAQQHNVYAAPKYNYISIRIDK